MKQASVALRHELHQFPELSNKEIETAARITRYFEQYDDAVIHENIGGLGLVVELSPNAEKTVLLRCELDALPIDETIKIAHASTKPMVSHKCGHDGHMAILAEVAKQFIENPISGIRLLLCFQPAEETGEGAKQVVQDEQFKQLMPDFVFALHNVPGFPMGSVIIRDGTMCCASRGVIIKLSGATAHAAQPETGKSPAIAMANLIAFANGIEQHVELSSSLSFATVVGAKLGEKAFGTAPSEAELYITLRAETDRDMELLIDALADKAKKYAQIDDLSVCIDYEDVFDATVNHSDAYQLIKKANPIHYLEASQPFRWSEDFGQFTQRYKGALFGLGAGESTPALHDQAYDFPDEVVNYGANAFLNILNLIDELNSP